jgi:hypothetical protein
MKQPLNSAQAARAIQVKIDQLVVQLAAINRTQPKGKTKIVTNLLSRRLVRIPVNTPLCCDPSSETYWSM